MSKASDIHASSIELLEKIKNAKEILSAQKKTLAEKDALLRKKAEEERILKEKQEQEEKFVVLDFVSGEGEYISFSWNDIAF